ncbi:hypothetical protein WJ96_06430 [Burkholderia ubonensis]|uniref:Uncharacterized protein n=2 Tax=Burkholderia ubonensis TaxID=101571 RepID=A0AAW3MYY1_9BURK|nr:hypothetical protein WJ96_06430 [Burkholderia ubonensis]KVZ92903.1 hypothetical protein WL25_18095 [Burkholderia ubonensis]
MENMNKTVVLAKHAEVTAGSAVVMSDAELDWLIDNDLHPSDVVSIRNPHQMGTLDTYLVAKKSHPVMQAEREKQDLLTSATRTSVYETNAVWDEPKGASSPRGWYWPKGSTCHGKTLCAGHYLDYGAGYRHDDRQTVEPGTIHCVVVAKDTGRTAAFRYVETVEEARNWIETEAAKFGHPRT